MMYLVGFSAIWGCLIWRSRRGEERIALDILWDIVSIAFFGALIGGRIGYVFLYSDGEGWSNFFSPWDELTGEWTGWYGMSFFGALLGALLFGAGATWWKKVSFFVVADLLAPTIPLGIFFGRIGNFLNGELFGRETSNWIGMSVDGVMRHPSQLYEALLEGMVLFLIVWNVRNMQRNPGVLLALFGIGYGCARFVAEFFRDEEVYVWGITQGQVYAFILIGISGIVFVWRGRRYDEFSL